MGEPCRKLGDRDIGVNPSFPKDLVPEMIAFFDLSCEAGRTSDYMCFYEAVE